VRVGIVEACAGAVEALANLRAQRSRIGRCALGQSAFKLAEQRAEFGADVLGRFTAVSRHAACAAARGAP